MKRFVLIGLAIGLIVLTGRSGITHDPKWYPSEWGADDERGAANRLTPEKVLEAASLIKEGKVYQLGRIYETDMPVFGRRHYSLRIPTMFGPLGDNRLHGTRKLSAANLDRLARNSMASGISGSVTSTTTDSTATILPRLKG